MMTRSFYRLTPTHLSLLRKAVVVSRQFVFAPNPWFFARLIVSLRLAPRRYSRSDFLKHLWKIARLFVFLRNGLSFLR